MILPKHTYFGGKTVYFDNVDPDLLSTIELKYMMEEIPDDVFSQVPVELFSQATYSQPDEVNNEERVGVNDNVIVGEEGHGPYETFVQESGECTNGFHYEHGIDSDDFDYELYDSENDAAIEDDNLDRVDETILPKSVATENLPIEKELPTEELHSPVNSDDEEQSSERDLEFNGSTYMETPSLKIRMRFANREI
ncbi:hypothetical protein D8674_031370 [Pyrus ussuriensis x Pyrus communis]|uniref:Uncharacterized protein n=1 Tax=Pyrus ussuriensis x Pyrus communis TaxID=2448454 RepID=A0A5N5F3Z5_9ROSA|nr:hypothetical protein D8674_031370 [Pyrus ussuriensis x Pyrus communis]